MHFVHLFAKASSTQSLSRESAAALQLHPTSINGFPDNRSPLACAASSSLSLVSTPLHPSFHFLLTRMSSFLSLATNTGLPMQHPSPNSSPIDRSRSVYVAVTASAVGDQPFRPSFCRATVSDRREKGEIRRGRPNVKFPVQQRSPSSSIFLN